MNKSNGQFLCGNNATIADIAVFNAMQMGLTIMKDPSMTGEYEILAKKAEYFKDLIPWYNHMKSVGSIKAQSKLFAEEFRLLTTKK